ncbi:aldose 1-epimerase family protein [Antiquaquibacter soli]|uniref:Aldose 1-epimerase family protein n=1 Tax=Antiquaquibacter soli TaxID=3064523 RepID=A0ABT9BTC1_9MICO|nr:aldose 1-epimerase family protein [Protaetiibacter sp. WY-16]MDO7883673.1 aldose 1-epimerase family protein [Protaetiibacter sp. WY-16]
MTTTSAPLPPTGDQYELELGPVRATITQVAAALRELSIDGVALTPGYPVDSQPPFAAGIVLVPWPNRVEDGRWELDGQVQQLDITEVSRNNAIHGLLRYTGYRELERDASSVTLGATVYPQHGYPFLLETTVRYALTEDGIRVTHTARNDSAARAPYAVGTHPFLGIGGVDGAELTLTVHASTRFDVDDRLNPLGEVAVDGDYDLRAGRRVAELELDTAFGGVSPVDGVVAALTAPDGREVRLLQDANHPYVQVFITREFPGVGTAIAIEPMTAPPNAFNTGLGVRWLEPGETWSVEWGIQYAG